MLPVVALCCSAHGCCAVDCEVSCYAMCYTAIETLTVFTIKDLKQCFVIASIDSGIDSYFSDSHIVWPVFLVFVQKMCMTDLTNGVINIYCLTISLKIVSRCC